MDTRSIALGPSRAVGTIPDTAHVAPSALSAKDGFHRAVSQAIDSELSSSYDSEGTRAAKHARVTELQGVRDSIAGLASDATSITLQSNLSYAAGRIVEEAATRTGFQIHYDLHAPSAVGGALHPQGASVGQANGPRVSQPNAKPSEAARVHLPQTVRFHMPHERQDPGLPAHLPPSLWGLVGEYDDVMTNFELAGDPAVAQGLIAAEQNPEVKDVYKAKAKLAALQAQRANSSPQGITKLDALIRLAEVALTRALRASASKPGGFPDLVGAVKSGQVGLVTAHLAGLKGLDNLTSQIYGDCREALTLAFENGDPAAVTALMEGFKNLGIGRAWISHVIHYNKDERARAALDNLFRDKTKVATLTAFMAGLPGWKLKWSKQHRVLVNERSDPFDNFSRMSSLDIALKAGNVPGVIAFLHGVKLMNVRPSYILSHLFSTPWLDTQNVPAFAALVVLVEAVVALRLVEGDDAKEFLESLNSFTGANRLVFKNPVYEALTRENPELGQAFRLALKALKKLK
jgi:hypothetical protein